MNVLLTTTSPQQSPAEFDLSELAALRVGGTRAARAASVVGVLLFSVGVGAGLLILIKNKYGLDGIVGGALVLVTSSLLVRYSVNNLLYVVGNPPTKLFLSADGIGFVRASRRRCILPWRGEAWRITIHDWRTRTDLQLRSSLVGEVRMLESFPLSEVALHALIKSAKGHGLSVTEGPYNDWTGLGLENRIIISAR